MAEHTITLSDRQVREFREEGWCIVERGLSGEQLAMLRRVCDESVAKADADAAGSGKSDGINVPGSRYFIMHADQTYPELHDFLHSELMAQIGRRLLGENVYLAWEQFVVKAAETGLSFAWHQDSAYADAAGADFQPVISCWCALDDVDESNGTVYILPYSAAGGGKLAPHVKDESINDLVGYHGGEPGIPVIVPAGGIALFTGLTFHRSGKNTTPNMRRVYLAQYASAPATRRDNGEIFGRAEPLLLGGRRVSAGAGAAV